MPVDNVDDADGNPEDVNDGVAVELFSATKLKLLLAEAVVCEIDHRF